MQYNIYGEFINNTIEPFPDSSCPDGQTLFGGVCCPSQIIDQFGQFGMCAKVYDPDVTSNPELLGGLPLITPLKMNTQTLTSDPIEGPKPENFNFRNPEIISAPTRNKTQNSCSNNTNNEWIASTGKCYSTKSCPSGYTYKSGNCYKCNLDTSSFNTTNLNCNGICPSGYDLSGDYCYKKSCEPVTNIYSNLKCYTTTCGPNKVYDTTLKKCHDCYNVKIDGVDTTYIDGVCWKTNCPTNHIYDKSSSMCKIPICSNGIYNKTSGMCMTCQTGGTFDKEISKCVYPYKV